MKQLTWTNERRKLRDLTPWERNPRYIKDKQAERLLESFNEFGQVLPICIGPRNEVYDGHQRRNVIGAADEYGLDYEVDVRVASRELGERERQKLTVYLHQGAQGSWDWEELANSFDFDDLVLWGFDEDMLLNMGAANDELAAPSDAEPQIDKAAELLAKWQVQPGDLWRIGGHRLVCGDCTDAATVARVMGGEKADMFLTDPPYGVSCADKNAWLNAVAKGNRIQTPIENDHGNVSDTSKDLWLPAFRLAFECCSDTSSFYLFMPQGGDQMMMMMMMDDAGWMPRHELIWVKNYHVLGRADYNYKHEPILYGWKRKGTHKFYGDFQTSIIECDKPQNSDLHPTMKPVPLIERLIPNNTLSGDLVYEPFAGSGTTLVAAENLGRRCFAVELSPAYCSVILQRMSDAFPGIEIECIS